MTSSVTASIATHPQQFVGYWGYTESTNLDQQLQSILKRFSSLTWVVQTNCLTDARRVTVAASDLDSTDAWVQVQPQHLKLGREPFGRVTLYWTQVGEVIWFATQLQLLLTILPSTTVSIPGLYGYSCFSYVPTPLTPIAGILAIAAGTEQIWHRDDQGKITAPTIVQCGEWQEATEQIQDEAAAIVHLQTLLKAAVARQIADIQDQTVGVFLSGGLDSAIVAALLVQAGVKVHAYTLDFGSAGISEYPYAEQVANYLHIPLTKVDASPQRVRQAIKPAIAALDLPFGDAVTVPLFLLNQAARQDTTIVFNGEGGDQLFAGWTNKPLIAASIYQHDLFTNSELFIQHYLRTFHRLWGYEAAVFQPTVYQHIQTMQPQDWLRTALEPAFTRSPLHQLRRATLMLKGAQNIQPRATNLAFSQGLWVRSPFCDVSLAQWSFQLSGELCLQGACEKYILKRAAESWLPSEIVWRQKRGMGVPITSWCWQAWWRSLGDWLNPAVLQAEGIWQPDLAERIVAGKLGAGIQGRRVGEILWLLITWQIWRSQFLSEPVPVLSRHHPFWLPPWAWRLRSRYEYWLKNNDEV